MLSVALGAELLDPLAELLALLRGQHVGHIGQCADQILTDPLGIRKALHAQLLERGPVDCVRQEQITDFLPGGAHPVVHRFQFLRNRCDQSGDLFLLLLRGIEIGRASCRERV